MPNKLVHITNSGLFLIMQKLSTCVILTYPQTVEYARGWGVLRDFSVCMISVLHRVPGDVKIRLCKTATITSTHGQQRVGGNGTILSGAGDGSMPLIAAGFRPISLCYGLR